MGNSNVELLPHLSCDIPQGHAQSILADFAVAFVNVSQSSPDFSRFESALVNLIQRYTTSVSLRNSYRTKAREALDNRKHARG